MVGGIYQIDLQTQFPVCLVVDTSHRTEYVNVAPP